MKNSKTYSDANIQTQNRWTIVRNIITVFLLIIISPANIHAQTNGGDCRSFITEVFRADGQLLVYDRLKVLATHTSARNEFGHTAYSDIFHTDITAPVGAVRMSQGSFDMHFSDRDPGSVDRTTLYINARSQVEVTLNKWGNTVETLSGLQCFSGHRGPSFIMTGYTRSGSHGVKLYTFLIEPLR